MFKNQDKIIFDNKIEISPVTKTQIPSQTKINKDYEQNYLEYKKIKISFIMQILINSLQN